MQAADNWQAGLYIRLSREDEADGASESVRNQRSMLEQYAKQCGFTVYDTYIDDGWSGTAFDRPAFCRMIEDIEAKKVNMVITKDLSRLGRDYIMTGHYMERYFPEKRVRYISLLDGIDTGIESSANEITPFRAIMNDMYAKDISKKIKSVKRDKQRKGLFIGGKPMYGYKMHPSEKNKIVIDEGAAPTVRRIFDMALQGMSCRKIAAALNAEGIAAPAAYCGWSMGRNGPYAGLWSSERISEMLQCETYLGHMVQGKSVKAGYKCAKSLKQARENWVVVENTHEPLVDKETFEKIQILLGSRRHTRSRTYDFLLKGLIFCHECGYPLAVINRPPASGEVRLFFICRTYQRFTKAGVCTCHSIKAQTVEDAVIGAVRTLCEPFFSFGNLLSLAADAAEQARKAENHEAEIQSIQGKIDSLTANLDRMYIDRLSGLLTEADFARIYARLKSERASLEAQLKALEAKKGSPRSSEERAKELAAQFLDSAYTSRELLVSLIERIELTEDKQIIIKFRFRAPEAISKAQAFTLGAAECIAH